MNTLQVLEHLEGRIRTVGRNWVTCYYAYTVLEIITEEILFYAVTVEADTNFIHHYGGIRTPVAGHIFILVTSPPITLI
jgi:hypothetical protein